MKTIKSVSIIENKSEYFVIDESGLKSEAFNWCSDAVIHAISVLTGDRFVNDEISGSNPNETD